ncbi:MAG: DNA ligase (NAD(+)) LigA [Candidatus Lokiarchaeota archaeon]|nr:DNA ligase (NAD(+)) LigA [Candidatus Lokiarchaeota archaeon]MBD3201936.1 DNA ligase (NAD(+)) LigA [Candidatus Lokiarchaeota archaeon]
MAKKQTELFQKREDQTSKEVQNSVSEPEIIARIEELEELIAHHRDLYYNKTPEISDAKYDLLEDELRELDPTHPLLFKIGQDSSPLFTKTEHIMPMMSQDKASHEAEFRKWAKKRNYTHFIIQYKLDGISIELQYTSGVFQKAVSRGDGKVGDDLTENILNAQELVKQLPSRFTGAIRAEVLLFRDMFNTKYSDNQNPRNAAAGLIRRKDHIGSEDLTLICYDAYSSDNLINFKDEIHKVKWLKEQGFQVVKTKLVNSIEDVIATRQEVIETIRDSLEFEIDGLVIKSRDIDLEDLKRVKPEKQIAFKFPAEMIDTTLLDVEWSVSGQNYTPVAVVRPVELMGSTIQRASLANPNIMNELGVKIGSDVMLSKRGDIIPKIEYVISTPDNAPEITIPTFCGSCETRLINEGTRLYCPNEQCENRLYHRLVKWIKKLGIKHFSEKLILQPLYETDKVKTIADLYELTPSDLIKFEGVQEKSAKKALTNLYAVKEIRLERFIAGFDIEGMGERMVIKAVKAGYDTLNAIKDASVDELASIDGFAEISAEALLIGINKLYPEMKNVLDSGKIALIQPFSEGILTGKSFCFTGKLNTMKRAEAEEIVVKHGGETKSSVTKNLSYLVTNSTEQTTKYKKAQTQGTAIITEDEFLRMIE